MSLLLDLLVLEDHILLDGEHFVPETLYGHQFVVWLSLLNLVENFKDLVVLVLHVNQAQFLLFILADEADQFAALLNLVQALHKLVGEVLDPFDVFVLDLNEGVSDPLFPLADDRNVWLVFDNSLRGVRLDLFKLLELVLVLFVDVVQVFGRNNTLEALILLLSLRIEGSRGIMRGTVDSESAFRVDLLGLDQECVVDDSLAYVTFHVSTGLLFLLWVNQTVDYFECRRVVMSLCCLAIAVLAAAAGELRSSGLSVRVYSFGWLCHDIVLLVIVASGSWCGCEIIRYTILNIIIITTINPSNANLRHKF